MQRNKLKIVEPHLKIVFAIVVPLTENEIGFIKIDESHIYSLTENFNTPRASTVEETTS